jgi:PAS domain S-box-containing protein
MNAISWVKERERRLGFALIPALIVVIIILALIQLPYSYEPPFLLGILNTIFLGVIPCIVAYIAFRVFSRSGSLSILFIGSGILIFGLGSMLAGWVNPLPNGPNLTVTVHNCSALISSLFILAGAVFANFPGRYGNRSENTRLITVTYSGIFIVIALLSLAALKGMTPPFFIPGSGPTVIRQIILEDTVAFFTISSLIFTLTYRKRKSEFLFWFTIALGLITIGLFALFFQISSGGLMNWVGRIAQYLGFILVLHAMLIARNAAVSKDLSLEDVVTSFFGDAEGSYKQLVETSTDAIVTTNGKNRIVLWNSAAERMFGYSLDETRGVSFPGLVFTDTYKLDSRRKVIDTPDHEIDVLTTEPVEVIGKKKDGSVFPIELSISQRWQGGRIIKTYILRDISERKKEQEALRIANRKLNLLSNITRHDINNQLVTLEGYLTLVKEDLRGPIDETYLEKIITVLERIASIIRFTKIYEDIGVHTPVWQNCRKIVENAVKEISLGKIEIINEFPSDAEIFADPLIVRVFYNLIDNAVQHGETLTTIRFFVEKQNVTNVLVCEDNGAGIFRDEKEKIFNRGHGKNTGFGLTISREILLITGITIRETGQPGKGARFEMLIPKGTYRISGKVD